MSNVSLIPVVELFEKLFSKLNSAFFDGQLPIPVITISSDDKNSCYGWCTSWKAWQDSSSLEGYYEINICSNFLNRDFFELLGTLLHEMVHLYDLEEGIKDTSRSGTYHNNNFKKSAESHGLIVSKSSKYGFSNTQLNPVFDDFFQNLKCLFSSEISLFRTCSSSSVKKKSSVRKYVCPCCGLIVRATKKVLVSCVECEEILVEEIEELDEES